MEFHRPRFISLRNHPEFNERWLHERLLSEPELLGLGELEVRATERHQPGAGRLDLLLMDPETLTRYEVEIQLGSTDESHIIRTIEYWDIERKRYPQYEHRAVIVAEDITSRFLNVIGLFNGAIPLIAVQIQGVEVNGAFTLIATTVVDLVTLGTEDEDVGETVDRSYWERKASPDTLAMTDQLLSIVRDVEPGLALKYNKYYVGIASQGVARNFVTFEPRKQHVIVRFKMSRSDETAAQAEESGLDMLPYSTLFGGSYGARVTHEDLSNRRESLRGLIRQAAEAFGR